MCVPLGTQYTEATSLLRARNLDTSLMPRLVCDATEYTPIWSCSSILCTTARNRPQSVKAVVLEN
jgi:hypothetical protein